MPASTLRLALSDPGALVPRRFDCGPEADEVEPLTEWQARAVVVWLRQKAELIRIEPMESMAYNIAGSSAVLGLADSVMKGEA